MKLQAAVVRYITYRRSLGEDFISNEVLLKAFVRAIGQDKNLIDVQAKQVDIYLAGKGPVTSHWFKKRSALSGFYNYVINRGYIKESPLPIVIPKEPQDFIPYIYKTEDLCALLEASSSYQNKCVLFEPCMIRALLLLLYGTGLRLSEAIKLTMADVDLQQAILTVRETKFYKTRMVPLGSKLTQTLSEYALHRQQEELFLNPESPFFAGRNGKAVNRHTFEDTFCLIRKKAGVQRTDNARYQPRIHDLRHTFAVHRLTAWYKEGADVQKWLPVLSVYLGHTCLSSTSVYLTMTPALLEEAGQRFQQYAFKEGSHD